MKHADKIVVLSSPEAIEQEQTVVIQLFEAGLQRFHLRKPDYSDIDYAKWLSFLPRMYWNRVVLHHHYHLAEQLGLGGVHLTEESRKNSSPSDLLARIEDFRAEGLRVSAAIHQVEALEFLGQWCDYLLVSPVFDSISKSNYTANPNLEVKNWKHKVKAQLFGLGGVQANNVPLLLEKGYDGAAVLGYIWTHPEKAVAHLQALDSGFDVPPIVLPETRPYSLSIAGHDPSAGAGLTADLKTMEQLGTYGLSVCTAITIQNDKQFEKVHWVLPDLLLQQIQVLQQRFEWKAVKIGLIQNWQVLAQLIVQFEDTPIVFDPIFSASAGFEFHRGFDAFEVLKKITLITPNHLEIQQLIPNETPENGAKILSQYCAVLLKGGHSDTRLGWDELWQNGERIATFAPQQTAIHSKHGSGCVLSAAIAAYLAKGKSLTAACGLAKQYVEKFLTSNDTLLGYHNK